MNYVGKMYTIEDPFHGRPKIEYIVIEQLTNTVALQDNETNLVVWVTLNTLQTKFKLKEI